MPLSALERAFAVQAKTDDVPDALMLMTVAMIGADILIKHTQFWV